MCYLNAQLREYLFGYRTADTMRSEHWESLCGIFWSMNTLSCPSHRLANSTRGTATWCDGSTTLLSQVSSILHLELLFSYNKTVRIFVLIYFLKGHWDWVLLNFKIAILWHSPTPQSYIINSFLFCYTRLANWPTSDLLLSPRDDSALMLGPPTKDPK